MRRMNAGCREETSMIYLDNAATSFPKPPEVYRAAGGVLEKIPGNPGRGGHSGALAGSRILESCRERLAQYLGCGEAERVIFCLNCTDALNIAIKGTLHLGDEVLVSHAEHNAVMRPLMGLHDAARIRVNILPPDENGLLRPETVADAITPKTALVVLCHASNVTGVIQPAREIAKACHERGVPLLLDAAQTAGTEDLSLIPADMIAMPGHKGLLGPLGTGVLYVGKGMLPRPFREGGTGSLSESMRQPAMLPDLLESGSANLPGIAGLLEGVKFVLRHREAIREYEHALAERLRHSLSAMNGITLYGAQSAPKTAVISMNIQGRDPGEIADLMNGQGIAVRAGLHCAPAMHAYLGTSGAVRMSLGPYNTEKEIDQTLTVIGDILRGKIK